MASALTAATLELPAVADTTLFFQSPANNLGASDSLAVGGTAHLQAARGLVRFAVAERAELAGARLISATLGFSVSKQPPGAVSSTFGAHRMSVDWREGVGSGNTGAPARAGEPTWEAREHPGVGWGGPGGKAGMDYVATASGTVVVSELGRYAIRSEMLVEDVRVWLANPSEQRGWMLISDGEGTAATARRVASREAGAEGPTLTLEYETGPAAPRIERVERKGGFVEFEFRAEAGNVYEVQQRTGEAAAGAWTVTSTHVAKLVSTNVVVRQPWSAGSAAFFRVADVADVD